MTIRVEINRHLLWLLMTIGSIGLLCAGFFRWSPSERESTLIIVNRALHLGQSRQEVSEFLRVQGYRRGGPRLGLQEAYQKEGEEVERLQFSFNSSGHLAGLAGDLSTLEATGVWLNRDMNLAEVKKTFGDPSVEKMLAHNRTNVFFPRLGLHLIFDGQRLKRFRLEAAPRS